MNKATVIGVSLGMIALVAGASYVVFVDKDEPIVADSQTTEMTPGVNEPTEETTAEVTADIKIGRYTDYSESKVADKGYDKTVIFFHAPWCVECRGFDKAINDGTVPEGTQILKVDYDSSQDLRKKYGVTIQSTFVTVNSKGDKTRIWNGYGKDKSVDAIIQNT